MKTLLNKKVTAVFTAILTLIGTLFLFTACNPVAPETPVDTSYSVTVLDPNGNGVAGITVQWCNDEGCYTAGSAVNPTLTDANGKVVNDKLADGEYHVKLNGVSADYTYDKDDAGYYTGANVNAENRSVTITLKPATAE